MSDRDVVLLMLSRTEHDLWVARGIVEEASVLDDEAAEDAERLLWEAREAVMGAQAGVRGMKWER